MIPGHWSFVNTRKRIGEHKKIIGVNRSADVLHGILTIASLLCEVHHFHRFSS